MSGVSFLLLTTSGTVFEGIVDSVVLPTTEGEIKILPAHADYSAVVGVGLISTEGEKQFSGETVPVKNPKGWIVVNGVVNIHGGKVEVLADRVFDSAVFKKGGDPVLDQLFSEYPQLASLS